MTSPQDDELAVLDGLLVLRNDSVVWLWAGAQRRGGLALVAGRAQLQRWGGTQRLWAALQNHAHRPQLGLAAEEQDTERRSQNDSSFSWNTASLFTHSEFNCKCKWEQHDHCRNSSGTFCPTHTRTHTLLRHLAPLTSVWESKLSPCVCEQIRSGSECSTLLIIRSGQDHLHMENRASQSSHTLFSLWKG